MQFNQGELEHKDLDLIFGMIENELEFALEKFPQFPVDPIHAIAIINEEAGEATKDALQWTYEPHKLKNKETLRIELVQTAAMCVRMLCGLESGDIKPKNSENEEKVNFEEDLLLLIDEDEQTD